MARRTIVRERTGRPIKGRLPCLHPFSFVSFHSSDPLYSFSSRTLPFRSCHLMLPPPCTSVVASCYDKPPSPAYSNERSAHHASSCHAAGPFASRSLRVEESTWHCVGRLGVAAPILAHGPPPSSCASPCTPCKVGGSLRRIRRYGAAIAADCPVSLRSDLPICLDVIGLW